MEWLSGMPNLNPRLLHPDAERCGNEMLAAMQHGNYALAANLAEQAADYLFADLPGTADVDPVLVKSIGSMYALSLYLWKRANTHD
jgi:hypothetical protein